MQIYPAIELQQGRCVSLRRGRLDEAEIWHVDPIEKAHQFAQSGASMMHVTDFDAVVGDDTSTAIVQQILREVPIAVQVAGGIRTRERAEFWLEQGAARVVIGTAAVINPEMVRECARFNPAAVTLAVDVWKGKVMSSGWREASAFDPADFIAHFEDSPLAGILLTDIAADIGDSDATLGMISALAGATRLPMIASGVVRGLDDISRLKYVGKVEGVLVARALFNRSVDLNEALAVAQTPTEKPADFM